MAQVANRIVEIQERLNTGRCDSARLQAEQKELWERHYPGCSYDVILWDSWALRRPESPGMSQPG